MAMLLHSILEKDKLEFQRLGAVAGEETAHTTLLHPDAQLTAFSIPEPAKLWSLHYCDQHMLY